MRARHRSGQRLKQREEMLSRGRAGVRRRESRGGELQIQFVLSTK